VQQVAWQVGKEACCLKDRGFVRQKASGHDLFSSRKIFTISLINDIMPIGIAALFQYGGLSILFRGCASKELLDELEPWIRNLPNKMRWVKGKEFQSPWLTENREP
jgi:hypothetical protein